MRRRAKRDIFVFFGVIVVLGLVALMNYNDNRRDLVVKMDALRRQAETEQSGKGVNLLDWKLLTETEGSARSGPTFVEDVKPYDGQPINLVGFMQPLEQFRKMSEFILLPLPIECYFCRIPPISHVVLIHMKEGETADLFKEPVVINGTIKLSQGPSKFFFTVEDAKLGPGIGTKLTPRRLKEEHMQLRHENTQDLDKGYEPPTTPKL